jgi:hypothetical protein
MLNDAIVMIFLIRDTPRFQIDGERRRYKRMPEPTPEDAKPFPERPPEVQTRPPQNTEVPTGAPAFLRLSETLSRPKYSTELTGIGWGPNITAGQARTLS